MRHTQFPTNSGKVISNEAKKQERGTGFTTGVADLNKPSNTIVARYGKDGKECLIPQENQNPRYLTIDECRSLFGYPKNFSFQKRTPAYKLLGIQLLCLS